MAVINVLKNVREPRPTARGFTLIELLLVVALIAIATGMASLALRDSANTQLENEAARLVALLESARAQSRGTGIEVRWLPKGEDNDRTDTTTPPGFRFVGLTPGHELPSQWLSAGVSAEVVGERYLVLGPEPLIGAHQIVLRLQDQRLTLRTDGLGPFEVSTP